jgi:phosphonate transport system permease protein
VSTLSSPHARDPATWPLQPWLSIRAILSIALAIAVLAYSGHRTEIGRLASMSSEGLASAIGLRDDSQVSGAFVRVVGGMFPPQIEEVREIARIADFDPEDLPFGSRIEMRESSQTSIDPRTLTPTTVRIQTEVLVEPFGYVQRVAALLLETIEIAAWATLLALLLAFPLAALAASNYTPHVLVHALVRTAGALLRAVPEFVSALVLVLVFGFGPLAGVVALGLHSAGFLCKFFAEDIENSDRAPQDALRAFGANKLKVLRHAVLPQVLPSYLAYAQYILERNIRSATVIGIVGAGGIGQELKGRFEMFHFGHVGTILGAILITVLTLELVTGRLRRRLIQRE